MMKNLPFTFVVSAFNRHKDSMQTRLLSLLAGIVAMMAVPASAQQEVPFLVIDGTTSPNGRYAIGWGIPYEMLNLSDPDNLLSTIDTEKVENYLVDLQLGEVMATLSSTHFASGGGVKNHSSLMVSWRIDSLAAFIVGDGKWEYDSVEVIYVVEPEKAWGQCSDAIPVTASLNRLFRSRLKQTFPGKDDVIDEFVFSVSPEGWTGENSIQIQAFGQLVKQESDVELDEVFTLTLPKPDLVGIQGEGAQPGSGGAGSVDPHLITANSAGALKLGMTVAEARNAMPGAEFSRTSDGEGIALISVDQNGENLMYLYAGEYDPDAAIDESATIEQMEVWGESYRTADGIHVGIGVEAAEAILGKVDQVVMSEIEMREYADFTNQPSGLAFRLSHVADTAGLYREGEMLSPRYRPDAFVYSIEVRGPFILEDAEIGGLSLYDPEDKVWTLAGKRSLGQAAQGEDEIWEAFGQAVQTWDFRDSGIQFDMISDEIGGPKSVFSITLKAPCSLETEKGIGIGAPKDSVIAAYADYPPDPEGGEGYFEGQDVHLVGSIYGGLLFTFENGQVSEIFLGALAE